MRRFYAPPENFNQSEVTLSLEETRHLRDVLRLREGEKVVVFDGIGNDHLCEIIKIEKQKTILKIIEIHPQSIQKRFEFDLQIALLKGDKFDLVVQKATELGVTHLTPLITARTELKIKDVRKKVERWQRISLEATKQCRRSDLMYLSEPRDFIEHITLINSQYVNKENYYLFSERGGERFSSIKSNLRINAIIGPEGGWEDAEIDFAKENGVQIITLGGRILRAETAAIAIPALLQNHFGDLN